MENNIVNGILNLSGVLIGSLISILAIVISNRSIKKRNAFIDICDQVGAYWNLEEEVAIYISKMEKEKRAPKTIKEDFRKIIEEKKGIRPTMTEREANKIKSDFKKLF